MSTTHQDDLGLLLSLQDRIPETPPASPPHSQTLGYSSDDGSPNRARRADMSVFRDAVKDYLTSEESKTVMPVSGSNALKHSKDIDIEKFSGLRIQHLMLSKTELSNCFSDIRFIRMPAIRNSLVGDTISGSWATVGILTEKGTLRKSSTGKNFCIWKFGCLDGATVSVFLFGDAYTKHWKESAGTVFALFNSSVRRDAQGKGFTLSVYSAAQIVKMGTSVDYGVCKGKRKDGMPCTIVINKRRGVYCQYHNSKASQKYSTLRAELKGGNLRTAFRDHLKAEGIYMVDPLSDRTNLSKPMQPVKVLSVEGLKKALSNAGQVTTNSRSQGIRFLTEVTEKMHHKDPSNGKLKQQTVKSEKRSSSAMGLTSKIAEGSQKPEAKRKKIEESTLKLIELDIVSSDEDA